MIIIIITIMKKGSLRKYIWKQNVVFLFFFFFLKASDRNA